MCRIHMLKLWTVLSEKKMSAEFRSAPAYASSHLMVERT